MDADGRNQKQLTFAPEREFWPVVSQDDRYIVFSSQGPDGVHVWRIDIDGTNRKQLTFGKGESFPALSPDGKSVFFSSMEPGWPAVGKVSIHGGNVNLVTEQRSARPVVSPDGKAIACLYFGEGPPAVAALSIDGGTQPRVFRNIPLPQYALLQWTPDGKGLAFIVTKDGVSNIWVQPMDGSDAKQLTHFTEDQIYRFAWSRDGKTIAVDRGTDVNDIFLLANS
jgi:Tol biopolymer transport system component